VRQGWRNLAVAGLVVLAGLSGTTHHHSDVRAQPTLGLRTGTFSDGTGFGQVKPREVFNGGDPTGLVTSITWHGWGQAQATGTGRGFYVAPNQIVAAGTIEPVRIVAFDLGTCNGRYMYAAVEWYFPQHRQVFDASQFEDVCIGAYYPPQAGQYQDSEPGANGYVLTLSGAPRSLSGSVSQVTASGKTARRVFSFHGRAAIDGNITLVSSGSSEAGRTLTGTWQTLGVTLAGCGSYLRSAAIPRPSCTFYF
jgi:hypothetical protein